MIDFPCHCGYRFSVPADMSGGLIQCPQCKRLNDVPLLSDLGQIESDGIYKLDGAPENSDHPQRVQKLTQIYTRDHYDADGIPIDNRGSYEPTGMPASPPHATPKYDPVTGELIREIDVKADTGPDPETLPVAKIAPVPPPKVINGMDVPEPLEAFAIPLRLFKPANLAVMLIVLLAHIFAQAMAAAIGSFYLVLAPFWLILHALLIAHFGNVVDETGPTSRQELPAVMRGLAWEDTGGPLLGILLALGVCYAPALFLLPNAPRVPQPILFGLAGLLFAAGTVLFPAALLTVITSGSVLNLRPDRLVLTAITCGTEYILAIAAWIIGGSFYAAGVIGVTWIGLESLRDGPALPIWLRWYSAYAVLGIGIYVLHALGWHLGTLYRRHHERFPWLFQRHTERTAAPPRGFAVQRPAPPPQKPNRHTRMAFSQNSLNL